MNDTLEYIADKFKLDLSVLPLPHGRPVEILPINRTIMAETLAELGFNRGAEIGVARGKHAVLLFEKIPNLKLYAVDPWKAWPGYRDYSQDRLDSFYLSAVENLKHRNCVIMRKPSMEAVKDVKDRSLDFVYIDGAHDFQSVTNDIAEWSKKIHKGGILYGHDFKRSTNPRVVHHVVDVVQSYTYAYRIQPWFVLGEKGHHDNLYREGTRSWMWVIAR